MGLVTINMYFDYPAMKDIYAIVSALLFLRKSVVTTDIVLKKQSVLQLQNANFLLYCKNYLTYDASKNHSNEYLYILSRKEEPNILKIGMTTRNVQKRVNEINSATGVLYPYSARKVYKVKVNILRWRSHPISWDRATGSVIGSQPSDGGSHELYHGSR